MRLSAFWAALVISAVAAAADMPLRVTELKTGAPSRVRLTNTSSQPITAWSIAAISRAGTGTHRQIYSADGYLSEVTHGLPGSNERIERIMPGETRELPLDPLPPGARVDVVAVVFADATAVGDERTIEEIFAKRARERDALKAVVDAFGEVLPAKHGAEALADLRQRFAALVRRDDAVPCRAALDAVQTYQQKTDPAEIDASLQNYADFVRREYDLAVRHSERRR